jgi:type IV pilus assembly protein PilW
MRTLVKNKSGFTLIELLMAMVTGIIVLAGIYAAFNSQQKIHTKESQVVDAEQNVRGAAHFMVREIRLAGMDQTGNAGAGFDIAGPHSIRFTLDFWDGVDIDNPGDGDVDDEGEDITYRFLAAGVTDADGIADAGATQLTRSVYNIVSDDFTDDPLAEDIHAVGFAYAFDIDIDGDGEQEYVDKNGDGVLDAGEEYWAYDSDGDGNLDWDNDTNASLGFTVNFDRIRAVRVWILARTRNPLRDYSGLKNFTVGNKVIKPNDNFKYRLLTTTVKCRNMGL